MMSFTPRTRAELYLLLMTVIWGSTFVLTKFVLESSSPFAYISFRFTIASILFTILFYRRLQTFSKNAARKGAVLGILLFTGFVLQTVGLKYTTASKSAFITGLMVIFTPLFQLLIERKPPKIGNCIGVALVAIGLYFLTSPEGSEFNIGDGITLVCAVLFSVYTVYLGIFGSECDPAHLTWMQFISTAVLSMLIAPFLEIGFIHFSIPFILLLVYLAILPTVVALYVMAKYQKDTTPTRSAVIYSMEPPFAALFAFFLIGETMGFGGIIGGILILFGLLISELSDSLFKARKERHVLETSGELDPK